MVTLDHGQIRGIPIVAADVEDFHTCIELCELLQVTHKGSIFTCWNGRANNDYLFERLDRDLANKEFIALFSIIKVEQLPRYGSNNAPLFLRLDNSDSSVKKIMTPFLRS